MIRFERIAAAATHPARYLAAALLPPALIAYLFEPATQDLPFDAPATLLPYILTALACGVVAALGALVGRRYRNDDLLEREAYLAVALGWLLCTLLAALPLAASGTVGFGEALFEAMSALTGTGMTAIAGAPERIPLSLLFWRAELQWLGGLAFIALTVAVLSRLTHGGLQLLRGEGTGAGVSRVRTKVAQVVRGMGRFYLALTVVFSLVLYVTYQIRLGLPPGRAGLEAVVETFAAYGNGAFTLHAAGMGHGDPVVQGVLSVMMVAGATNVTLAFLLVRRGQVRSLVTNPEWRFFFLLATAIVVACTLLVARAGGLAAATTTAFQALSLATGTGLLASDYTLWPHAAQVLVLLAFLIGGTAGSAAGGLKAFRALLLAKTVARETRRLVHPRAVIPVRVGRRVLGEDTVTAVIAFFFAYLTMWLLGTFALSLLEPHLGVLESGSAALAALGNIAGGLGAMGPTAPASAGLGAGKAVLAALMWCGRMELFAAFLVFTPQSWRN